MAENLLNLTNGEFDEKGMLRLLGTLLNQSGVVQSAALLVAAQGTPDMSVKVAGAATGHDIVFIASDGATYHGWNTADKNVTITANATGVTKKDAIVAYADLTAGSATSNNPGALKFIAVRGSGTNTAPDNAQIVASAVGSNPYSVLAHVTVANGASSINSGNISDTRSRAILADTVVDTNALAGSAVTTAKIANANVTAAKIAFGGSGSGIWWEEIARASFTSGSGITVSSIPARKYLRVLVNLQNTSTVGASINLNGDTSANYTRRSNTNGTQTTQTNDTYMLLVGGTTSSIYAVLDILNLATAEKLIIGKAIYSEGTGDGTAPSQVEFTGKWVNTTNQISSILVSEAGGGSFTTASEIIVLGHD